MEKFFASYQPQAYAVMRMVLGFLFLCHGAQKIGFFGGGSEAMNVPIGLMTPQIALLWVAGFIELIDGALVTVGLFTSIAAFIMSGEMAVAYFMMHQGKALLPIVNQGELPALYCFAFLYIAARGDGPGSIGGEPP